MPEQEEGEKDRMAFLMKDSLQAVGRELCEVSNEVLVHEQSRQ